MAQKKSYSRYFIILQEDERGYALASDKLPTGYVKLELRNDKCKVSYYVQNLKKESAPYYMTLILGKKDMNKIIKIGELNIDNYGRADVSYEYLADNIADTGMSMDNVSGAAIVKLLDKNIISVLSGFLTSDIPKWREYEIIEVMAREEKAEEAKIEKEKIEEVKKEEEKSIFDKYEESIEQARQQGEDLRVDIAEAEQKKEEITVQKEKTTVQVMDMKEETKDDAEVMSNIVDSAEEDNLENNEKPIQHREYEPEDDISKEKEATEENIIVSNEYSRDYKGYEKWPKGKTGEFFKAIAKGLEEVKGEIIDIKKCVWYKVPIKDVNEMYYISDYNKYSVIYYPMINYYKYIRPYGHYLIGYKCDDEGKMKYLVYGIPGGKSAKDQPFGGKSGFVTWVPAKSGRYGCEGYWLMFYDFRASTILIPVK